MSRTARYVTQAAVYDTFYTGPLTDSKIKKYIKAGKYGEDAKRALEETSRVQNAKLLRKIKHRQLLSVLLS